MCVIKLSLLRLADAEDQRVWEQHLPHATFACADLKPQPLPVCRSVTGQKLLRGPQIIKKFGCRFNARNQQMVSRAGAGNVQKMSFSIVDISQIRVITDSFDTLLQGNDFIIASHYCHGAPQLGQAKAIGSDLFGTQRAGICPQYGNSATPCLANFGQYVAC
jgi:hypothetical protein